MVRINVVDTSERVPHHNLTCMDEKKEGKERRREIEREGNII
jgi:hypothetical protein